MQLATRKNLFIILDAPLLQIEDYSKLFFILNRCKNCDLFLRAKYRGFDLITGARNEISLLADIFFELLIVALVLDIQSISYMLL